MLVGRMSSKNAPLFWSVSRTQFNRKERLRGQSERHQKVSRVTYKTDKYCQLYGMVPSRAPLSPRNLLKGKAEYSFNRTLPSGSLARGVRYQGLTGTER